MAHTNFGTRDLTWIWRVAQIKHSLTNMIWVLSKLLWPILIGLFSIVILGNN